MRNCGVLVVPGSVLRLFDLFHQIGPRGSRGPALASEVLWFETFLYFKRSTPSHNLKTCVVSFLPRWMRAEQGCGFGGKM